MQFSVSATSRTPRSNEADGADYYFLGVEGFRKRIDAGDFLEWQEVYEGQYYGTLKSEVERIWQAGGHLIFDLDVEGGVNLKKIFAEKALAIFIQPPSVEALEERLKKRSTETEDSLRKRVAKATYELTFSKKFDLIITNDKLETACAEAVEAVGKFLSK